MLSEEEISSIYPEPVDFFGLHTFRFWACSSQFEIPYLYIGQQLVEHVDSGRLKYPLKAESEAGQVEPGDAPSSTATLESLYGPATVTAMASVVNSPYYQLMEDIHATINFNFGNYEESYYFEPFRKGDIATFVFDRSSLIPYLQSLRTHNVKLFLMTNSNHHYTQQLMNYAFGVAWRELFDLVIYRSKKPHFFLFNAPFMRIIDASLPGEVKGLKAMSDDEPLVLGQECYGGNLKKLNADLLHDSPVIYVGDELFGDVVAPSCYANWKTIAIVEELQEAERNEGWKSPSAELVPPLEDTAANLSLDRWGNYFLTSDGKLTFYGALMHHFADIAIPCVSRLAHFDPDQALLPHHPLSQSNATTPSSVKQRATVHLTESSELELPPCFTVPTIDSMALVGELSKRLKDIKWVASPSAQ